MAPKHHPTPLSGGDRKALNKEINKARAMANILASRSAEMRAKGEAMIQQADKLLCESWNERMWSDGDRGSRGCLCKDRPAEAPKTEKRSAPKDKPFPDLEPENSAKQKHPEG